MGAVHVYMCLYIASIESTAGNKIRLFPSPFLILAEAFRKDYMTACSTALRSVTEKIELRGYVTLRIPSK